MDPSSIEPLQDVFDRDWYLARNPDVAAQGVDPWRHFVTKGLTEGRDPGYWFDSTWYLFRYPDVGNQGLVALDHYLSEGLEEGRYPNAVWESREGRGASVTASEVTTICALAQRIRSWTSDDDAVDTHLATRAPLPLDCLPLHRVLLSRTGNPKAGTPS